MEHFALIVFSICVQAAIGIMVFVALAKLLKHEGVYKTALLSAAGLAIVSLLASLLHLGRPLSAINSLIQFGSSWISREIWFTGIFAVLAIVIALLILFKPAAKKAVNVLIPIAAIIGLIDVFATASIYYSTSVPAWQHGSVFVEHFAATLSMGALLFLALSNKEAARMRLIASAVIGIAVVIQVAAMAVYYVDLGANASLAAQESISLLSGMSAAIIIKWVFILLGAGLLILPKKQEVLPSSTAGKTASETAAASETGHKTGLIYLAAALLIIGQIGGRYLFYAAMIITGVGLN